MSVQEEDSKVEQMNYVMRKVKLKLNLQNDQISIRNTREIHEIGQNSKISISFNRLVFPLNLTDSQPLDNKLIKLDKTKRDMRMYLNTRSYL